MSNLIWRRFSPLLGMAFFAAYAPLFIALPAVAPEVAYRLFSGERLFILAVYTAVSYCVPVALVGVHALKRVHAGDIIRIRRALLLLCAVNWLPHCLAVLGWVLVTDQNAWVP